MEAHPGSLLFPGNVTPIGKEVNLVVYSMGTKENKPD